MDGGTSDGSAPCTPCGPVLYWKFDESGGVTAVDSSGNGLDGTYIGSQSGPTRSTVIPPVTFADPASRQFVTAKDQAVELANAPAILRPPNNITIAVWYRAPALDFYGSEVVSLGENYYLLLRRSPATIELAKAQPGGTTWVQCSASGPTYFDGTWHHLAGVISTAGMKIYFDGTEIGTNPDGTDIAYPLGTSLFAGRHGSGGTGYSFNGYMDEVRIYTRALSVTEIGLLAAGSP
jgi:hypothetical protein